MDAIEDVRSSFTLDQIRRAIESGDVSRATAVISDALVGTSLIEFNRQITQAVQQGGDFAAKWANKDAKIVFAMNVTDSNTSRFIREYQAEKVQQITRDMKTTIGSIVRGGVNSGQNPITTARRVKEGLGLTPHQERAVANYRNALENRKSIALDRALRDKRFDRTVVNAIRNQKDIPADKIDRMVSRYRDRYVARRAQNIARTESIRLLSKGQEAYWKQLVDQGKIDRNRIRRFWKPTFDSKLREEHAAIPRLNPDGVGLEEPFKSPLGMIMYPGDPSAVAANTINCRCAVFTRVVGE